MRQFEVKPLSGEWKSVLLVLVAANAIFMSLALLTTYVSRDVLRERVLEGFESGALPLETDVEFKTWMFGNECLILQMLLNPDEERLQQALGPKVHFRADDRRQCHLVLELARYGTIEEAPDYFRYTRYWHGHNATAAALLAVVDFATLRPVLRAIAYGSLVLLAMVGWFATHRLRVIAVTTAATGAAFWGQQDFSHSLGNGPADALLILGFASLLLRYRKGDSQEGYVTWCAAFGALVAYMEFFMGQLPTAAALLLPVGYVLADEADSDAGARQRWQLAISGVFGFVLGAALTIATKQVLAYVLFGAPAVTAFVANLGVYTQNLEHIGIQGSDDHLKSAVYALGGTVWKWGKVLTYGSDWAARTLFLATALAWIAAALLACRSRSALRPGAFLPCAAGAAVVVAWIAMFPSHTLGHGWFMVRIMLAPIALGWAALIIEAGRRLTANGGAG